MPVTKPLSTPSSEPTGTASQDGIVIPPKPEAGLSNHSFAGLVFFGLVFLMLPIASCVWSGRLRGMTQRFMGKTYVKVKTEDPEQ